MTDPESETDSETEDENENENENENETENRSDEGDEAQYKDEQTQYGGTEGGSSDDET